LIQNSAKGGILNLFLKKTVINGRISKRKTIGFSLRNKNRARLAASIADWSQRDFYDPSVGSHRILA
jgi:hypothetical protein